jgi:hypothetical protein
MKKPQPEKKPVVKKDSPELAEAKRFHKVVKQLKGS